MFGAVKPLITPQVKPDERPLLQTNSPMRFASSRMRSASLQVNGPAGAPKIAFAPTSSTFGCAGLMLNTFAIEASMQFFVDTSTQTDSLQRFTGYDMQRPALSPATTASQPPPMPGGAQSSPESRPPRQTAAPGQLAPCMHSGSYGSRAVGGTATPVGSGSSAMSNGPPGSPETPPSSVPGCIAGSSGSFGE